MFIIGEELYVPSIIGSAIATLSCGVLSINEHRIIERKTAMSKVFLFTGVVVIWLFKR